MKTILGGKDAQGIENFRAFYPDFKVANNDFKIVNGLVLEFRGRRNSPLFYRCFEMQRNHDTSGDCQLLVNDTILRFRSGFSL